MKLLSFPGVIPGMLQYYTKRLMRFTLQVNDCPTISCGRNFNSQRTTVAAAHLTTPNHRLYARPANLAPLFLALTLILYRDKNAWARREMCLKGVDSAASRNLFPLVFGLKI
jgi:hypothetical protein